MICLFFGGVCSGVTIWPPAFGVFKRGECTLGLWRGEERVGSWTPASTEAGSGARGGPCVSAAGQRRRRALERVEAAARDRWILGTCVGMGRDAEGRIGSLSNY